jgi:hypothetical protein
MNDETQINIKIRNITYNLYGINFNKYKYLIFDIITLNKWKLFYKIIPILLTIYFYIIL